MTPVINLYNDANRIFIKRDDLLPFSFGGNKVRIAEEFFSDMEKQGKNCIISYGNARSNLNRAISNMACAKGIPCYIVSPADDDGARIDTANSRLVRTCGAHIRECVKQNVAETVEKVLRECESRGLKPYYIYGNKYGKGNEATPVNAYVETYKEIKRQERELGIDFDYIFCATGTGMTLAGLICGRSELGGNETIVGISIARDKEKETAVIRDYCSSYLKNAEKTAQCEILVNDDYICGGYGKYDRRVEDLIRDMYKTYGIPLDPTYTGKAFRGMKDLLEKNGIENKNVLFIHTGGTPLFFDFIEANDTEE